MDLEVEPRDDDVEGDSPSARGGPQYSVNFRRASSSILSARCEGRDRKRDDDGDV